MANIMDEDGNLLDEVSPILEHYCTKSSAFVAGVRSGMDIITAHVKERIEHEEGMGRVHGFVTTLEWVRIEIRKLKEKTYDVESGKTTPAQP